MPQPGDTLLQVGRRLTLCFRPSHSHMNLTIYLVEQVAERAGVNIPSGCNSGSCGTCEACNFRCLPFFLAKALLSQRFGTHSSPLSQVAVYKYAAGAEAGAEAVVRACIARVPPGYTRLVVDVLDDPLWGADGWDT